MAARTFCLETLLAPVAPEKFFQDFWERQALVLPRDEPSYYDDLLSLEDVDRVIAFTRPKFLDPDAFAPTAPRKKSVVQGWLAEQKQERASYPGIGELRQAYDQGKTVVIMTMQQRWLPVATLCRNLEAVFHCPVHANLYLTPAGAQGFDTHFDPHEVFVLQLHGRKQWRLYGEARRFPLLEERFQGSRDQLGPPREVCLMAGDLLYIPRGHVHEAFTSDCASLHLTVGVNVFRWADLLHEALDMLTDNDERFRASLPPGIFASKDLSGAFLDRFGELLASLAHDSRAADAVRGLGGHFFRGLQPLPDAHFAPSDDVEAIDLDTVLEKVPGAVCRVVGDNGWVAIEFPGGQVGGPPKIASAFRFVAHAQRFSVRSLPDELGPESKLVLARRLVRERLLRVARSVVRAIGKGQDHDARAIRRGQAADSAGQGMEPDRGPGMGRPGIPNAPAARPQECAAGAWRGIGE